MSVPETRFRSKQACLVCYRLDFWWRDFLGRLLAFFSLASPLHPWQAGHRQKRVSYLSSLISSYCCSSQTNNVITKSLIVNQANRTTSISHTDIMPSISLPRMCATGSCIRSIFPVILVCIYASLVLALPQAGTQSGTGTAISSQTTNATSGSASPTCGGNAIVRAPAGWTAEQSRTAAIAGSLTGAALLVAVYFVGHHCGKEKIRSQYG